MRSDWAHFKDEGWLAYTKLQRGEIAAALCEGWERHKE